MPRAARTPRRKPRLRTELSEADERTPPRGCRAVRTAEGRSGTPPHPRLRPGRACALGREHESGGRTRRPGPGGRPQPRRSSCDAIHRGQAVRIEDTEAVWRGLHDVIAEINDELTEMTVAYGSKLRREAGLRLPPDLATVRREWCDARSPDCLVGRAGRGDPASCRRGPRRAPESATGINPRRRGVPG